jgi:uncharacterized protein (TIGR02246 family)
METVNSDAVNEGRNALASVEAAWNEAGRSWNPDALAKLYTTDALLFGGRPGHAVGVSAIRDYFGSYAGVIHSGTMQLVDQQIVHLAPGVFVAQGFVDFSFVLADNPSTKSFLRTTLVVVLQGGQWKIRQHHFSPTPAAPPLGQS